MSFETLRTALQTAEAEAQFKKQSLDAWITDQRMRAEKVALFRQYAEGDHRANLTPEMANLLRVSKTDSMNQFNCNYMDVIIQTMVDRLEVTAIDGDKDTASAWAKDVLAANRFDGLQAQVHEASVRDGDTYVMVSYDDKAGRVLLTHEPAYDGTSGLLVVQGTADEPGIMLAAKVWQSTTNSLGDTLRVNVYLPGEIRKYIGRDGGALMPYQPNGAAWPLPWTLPGGEPIGVPVVHFPNRGTSYADHGLSEIENAIPLQDALNRTLYSMVMCAELTAFQIRIARGFQPPAGITPGAIIVVEPGGLSKDQIADMSVLPQGEIMPFIQQAQWLTGEMGKITRTPAPEFMGSDNASGEALKQREIGLIGKVKRYQVRGGNGWEDVMVMAHRAQTAWGNKKPPAYERFTTRWRDPELRNDEVTIKNAVAIADRIGEQEFLRLIAPVYGWDEAKIEKILAQKQAENNAALTNMMSNMPQFNQFNNQFNRAQ